MKINEHLTDIYKKDVIRESELMKKCIASFDSLKVNPILSYFTIDDINQMYKIATSPAMHCDMPGMYKALGEIMSKRGFKLIGGGTNRRAYECIYDDRIVAKVATDHGGFTSNLREYVNQNVLKPFCNKIFEVSPCGTLAIIEKVVPIKDVSEFKKYSNEIFDILYFKIRNNSIAMEDIGTRSMKNWGYRSGFGPVLLDYPTMYVADPKKRLCKNIVNGKLCCGTLDYDDGFNRIVCSECGGTYFAKTLAKPEGDDIKSLLNAVGYLKKEGVKKMKIEIIDKKNGEVIETVNCGGTSNHVDKTVSNYNNNRSVNSTTTSFKSKKKRPKVSIIDLNPEVKIEEETTINPVQAQEKLYVPEIKKEAVIIEETGDVDLSQTDDKKKQLIQKFNQFNSGINFEEVNSDSASMSTTELAKMVNEVMTIDKNPYVNETDAYKIYMDLSIATIKDNNTRIDINNVGIGNTMINDMLRKVSNNTDINTNMFPVFFKLINNVKNTVSFFNSILSLWYAFIDIAPFENHTDSDSVVYCILTNIIDIYREIVRKAFEDYRFNIVLSGGLSYNISNVLSIINVGIGQIKDFVTNIDDSDEICNYKYINIEISRDFAEFTEINTQPAREVEEVIEINSEPSPVELYDAMVQGNEKTGTKHQQERFGNKKKRSKKNRHRR